MASSHPSPPRYVPLPGLPSPPLPVRSTPSPVQAQGKSWCFTLNNWTATDVLSLRELGDDLRVEYLVFGQELATTTGTPHLQGFVRFRSNKRFNAALNLLPFGVYLFPRYRDSTDFRAAEYCKKDGQFEEFGTCPVDVARGHAGGQATSAKWAVAKAAAKEGRLDDIDDALFIKYYSTFKRIQKDYMSKPSPLAGVCGLWIWGATGTGKSHSVITQHPDRFIKPLNKWWDGYQGEKVVHIDELDGTHVCWVGAYLKKWADKWPFDAEVKGGALCLRPKLIVVTSNYSLEEIGFKENDLPALKRRFRVVEKFRDQDIIVQ